MITETLTIYRGDTDKMGNPNKAEHGTIEGIIVWGPGAYSSRARPDNALKGESRSLQIELYAERGADLKPRDRIKRANGQSFSVLAGPMWDQSQPQTGHNFGWMVFQVETVSG